MFLSCSLMYFVIPRYILKGKYIAAASWVLVLFASCALISIIINVSLITAVRSCFHAFSAQDLSPRMRVLYGLMAGLRGGITVGGIAAAIKLMKYWYLKEQRNIQLQKENLSAQMQLLKAQVHPHFLFNTLNNIYSLTQKVSPVASSLVIGLSDMMRYILHEGSKQWVPLSKELKMIDDYMMLEQIRYGSRLEIDKDIPDTNELLIAPLLLLPFVENCFKHGTSNMLEHAWIRISIHTRNDMLKMTLINSKLAGQQKTGQSSGIGIINVKKRLDLLYPGKHELMITEEEDVFIVNLRVQLETDHTSIIIAKSSNELVHA